MSPLRIPPAALPPVPCPAPSPASVRAPVPATTRQRRLRWALSPLPLLLIGGYAAFDWPTVQDSAVRLAGADPWWLLAATGFNILCWVAASVTRQGALPERLPPGPLLASQFAAGAANHVLPAGLGAHAVTLRFLRNQGIPLPRATASLALYSLVKPVTKMLLILAFLAASPGALRVGRLLPDAETLALAGTGIACALGAAALLVTAVPPLRRPLPGCLNTALTDARLLHTRPVRVLQLWGGAAAFWLLQACVLASVGSSLGLHLPWVHVIFAYLAASAAVGAVPAPGGIGPVDAALVFTLAVFGAPMVLATGTVIGFRVITVWLPLLPGALVLSGMVRRRML
ncbi:lysylphosphatidylglycerol synthase transmembrane domain-containing protein [Streptomyces blattellae]|uniref:lysylphosphatidylglycerol synthase transmembrane domain-containing protein n=1 Tax=Streptomyces blattellae TaxID=2569855 RepID=UPI0012B99746|nr:lysylphosphatidylglycerol synthase transmembrane domain-containing protein [Streptomyces blattellae]